MSGRRSRTTDALRSVELDRPLDDEHVRLLRLVSYGLTRVQMAELLDVSAETIKLRCRVLYARLGAINAANAVRLGFERRLLGDGDVPDGRHDVPVTEDELRDEVDP